MTSCRTVLVVENDADVREVVFEVLDGRGFHTLTAEHGREALDVLRRTPDRPGLILLDLTMPVMSGWELLEVLRADPALAGIPVVVMSAVGELGRGATGPWDGVLRKPVTLEDLIATVERYCGAPGAPNGIDTSPRA